MTLSLSSMGFRGISNQSVFVANLCFLAGIELLVSAQWEMVRGNTFDYTVLGAFGKPSIPSKSSWPTKSNIFGSAVLWRLRGVATAFFWHSRVISRPDSRLSQCVWDIPARWVIFLSQEAHWLIMYYSRSLEHTESILLHCFLANVRRRSKKIGLNTAKFDTVVHLILLYMVRWSSHIFSTA